MRGGAARRPVDNRSKKASQPGLPSPGDVLAGRFRVERVLGVGGMGSVFAAEDLRFARQVAIKLMLPDLMEIPEFAGRFAREAQASSSLSSEHAARVFEVGTLPDGSPYMVLELLQGRDLDRVSRSRGPLPIQEAVQYVLETCHAIAEAHGLGIVHRDLKPSNLYLTERQGAARIIKVLDFGISKSTKLEGGGGGGPGEQQTLTATDSTLGSPHYMSPEQLRSAKNVDRRTDIWSLGIILHKLLTGNLAFETDSVGAHLAAIVADPPTPLRYRRPEAPEGLEAVILRCLQKDLSLRFQNVGQLALALAPFAPPTSRGLVESIAAIVGREAYTPLAPLGPAPTPEGPLRAGTVPFPGAPAWQPVPGPSEVATVAAWAPPPAASPTTGSSSLPGSVPASPVRSRGALGMAAAGGLAVAVLLLVTGVVLGSRRSVADPVAAAGVTSASATAVVPVAAPTATAAPVAAPREVRVKIEMEPADATLELDGVPVRDNPILLPRGEALHKLVIRAPGYAAESREVSAREDTALAVVLHHADAGAGPAPQGRRLKGPVETSL